MKPLILGQAPSSLGDGRTPFTGFSGNTLRKWAKVDTRHELLQYFDLDNLIPRPLPPLKPKDFKDHRRIDAFPVEEGLQRAKLVIDRMTQDTETKLIIALGVKVSFCLGIPRKFPAFQEWELTDHLTVIRLPHPSGLNRELNDEAVVWKCKRVLRELKKCAALNDSQALTSLIQNALQ